MVEKTTPQKLREIEEFFRASFDARDASLLPPSAASKFNIVNVVKIDKGNGTPPIHLGLLEPKVRG